MAERAPEKSSVRDIARWLRAVHPEEIPARAIEQAKLILLDTLGWIRCFIPKVCLFISHHFVAEVHNFFRGAGLGQGHCPLSDLL